MTPGGQSAAVMFGALLTAFSLGWIIQPTVSVPRRPFPAATAEARSPGVSAGILGRIAALDGVNAPDTSALPTPALPAAAAPDIASVFRAELAAIEQTATGPVAWVVDLNQLSGRRAVRPGEPYKDGWRVTAIGSQVVELRKRGQSRQVSVFETSPSGQETVQ